MEKINVISPVYKNVSVNFNGFIINFNAEGKSIIEIEEEKLPILREVFKTHSNIYEGNELPKKENVDNTKSDLNNINDIDNTEISFLKESNKNLAKENAILKKEKDILIQENVQLKKEKYFLEEENVNLKNQISNYNCKENQQQSVEESQSVEKSESQSVEKLESQVVEESQSIEEENQQSQLDNNKIKEQLNKKTVAQLKELLNEDFGDFKNEWKVLTKKDDIINYIISKI